MVKKLVGCLHLSKNCSRPYHNKIVDVQTFIARCILIFNASRCKRRFKLITLSTALHTNLMLTNIGALMILISKLCSSIFLLFSIVKQNKTNDK